MREKRPRANDETVPLTREGPTLSRRDRLLVVLLDFAFLARPHVAKMPPKDLVPVWSGAVQILTVLAKSFSRRVVSPLGVDDTKIAW